VIGDGSTLVCSGKQRIFFESTCGWLSCHTVLRPLRDDGGAPSVKASGALDFSIPPVEAALPSEACC
jgi:hypothetical protein